MEINERLKARKCKEIYLIKREAEEGIKLYALDGRKPYEDIKSNALQDDVLVVDVNAPFKEEIESTSSKRTMRRTNITRPREGFTSLRWEFMLHSMPKFYNIKIDDKEAKKEEQSLRFLNTSTQLKLN